MTPVETRRAERLRPRALAALGVASLLALCTGVPARATPVARVPDASLEEQILAAAAAIDENDCDTALPILDVALARPEIKDLNPEIAPIVYQMGAACSIQTEADERTWSWIVAGTAFPKASDWLWLNRISMAAYLGRRAEAVEAWDVVADTRPAALGALDVRILWRLDVALRSDPGGQALRLKLLKPIADGRYRPNDPFADVDGLKLIYAGMLADMGRAQEAWDLVIGLDSPDILLSAAVDPRWRARFDAPDAPNFRAAALRRLLLDDAAIARAPDHLEGLRAKARTLVMLDRAAEALALLDDAADRMDGGQVYADVDQVAWFWNDRAWVLGRLGRFDEAVEAMTRAAGLQEDGRANTSQSINLALLLVRLDRPDAALAALAQVESGKAPASPFGRVWALSARICALAEKGDAGAVAEALSRMEALQDVNPEAATDARLCADDLDGAARSLQRRLSRGDQRIDALLALSEYDPLTKATAHDRRMEARWAALRARPDVQAAAQAAGAPRRIPMQRPI